MNVKDYRKQVEAQLGASLAASHTADLAAATAPPHEYWSKAIEQLADGKVSAEIRKDALHLLQAAAFLGSEFAPYRPGFLAALRAAATDPDQALRRSVFDILVNMKDEFARQKLADGLRGVAEALIPPAAALSLLARDDHVSASDLARDLIQSAKADIATRAQAARVLAADPSATDLLARIMRDKGEVREVRRASAVALKSLNPTLFAKDAVNILADATDFKDIKATVKGALERAGVSLPLTTRSSDDE